MEKYCCTLVGRCTIQINGATYAHTHTHASHIPLIRMAFLLCAYEDCYQSGICDTPTTTQHIRCGGEGEENGKSRVPGE